MPTRTVANGGGNWNALGTWVEGVVPTSADDVVFTATSGTLTVNTSTAVCKTFDCTNFIGTLATSTNTLTVSGSVTLVSGMTITGTGLLTINATATINFNGKTWPGGLTFLGTFNPTLASTLNITGQLSLADGGSRIFSGAFDMNCGTLNLGGTNTISGNITSSGTMSVASATTSGTNGAFNINIGGGITFNTTTCVAFGTATIVMTGAGTIASMSATNYIGHSITFACSGTVTIGAAFFYKTGTLLYTSGTVVTTGAIINSLASFTYNMGTQVWAGFVVNTASTLTLLCDMYIGSFTYTTTASTQNINGAFRFYVRGAWSNSSTRVVGGTATVVFATTTSQSISAAGIVQNNVEVNATGTVTITTLLMNTNSFKYIAGTMGATVAITVSGSMTIDCNGMSFTSATFNANATITLLSDLNISTTLLWAGTNATITINGADIQLSGGISLNSSGTILQGTAKLYYIGTGKIFTQTATTVSLRLDLIINTSGTLTISDFNFGGSKKITYISGTVTCNGTLSIVSGSVVTFDTSGMNWNNITTLGSCTLQLDSVLNVAGTLTYTSSTSFTGNYGFITSNFTLATPANALITFKSGNTYVVNSAMTAISTAATPATFVSSNGTSYANTGGTGNRSSIITMITDINMQNGSLNTLIDGALGAGNQWSAGQSGKYMTFDFGTASSNYITEITWKQSNGTTHGVWKLSGSNDNTNWVDIGASFTLGAITQVIPIVATDTYVAYRYFKMSMVSGVLSNSPFIYEIEFKIGPGSPAYFKLSPGATQDIDFINSYFIDSSSGQTLWSFKPTYQYNGINWRQMVPNKTIAKVFRG